MFKSKLHDKIKCWYTKWNKNILKILRVLARIIKQNKVSWWDQVILILDKEIKLLTIIIIKLYGIKSGNFGKKNILIAITDLWKVFFKSIVSKILIDIHKFHSFGKLPKHYLT